MSVKETKSETIFIDNELADTEVIEYGIYKLILREVCKVMCIPEDQLKRGSNAVQVEARMYAVYLIEKYTSYNCRHITEKFGTKNHFKIYRLIVRLKGYKDKNKFAEKYLKTLNLIENKITILMNHKMKDVIEINPKEYPICINIPNSNRLIFLSSPNNIKIDLKSKFNICQ